MLGLPQTTEINHPFPKKALFDKFKPSAAEKQRFDADIKRLALVGEILPTSCNIVAGETVKAFYVVLVDLRNAECDKKNLALISRLIPQNMLFVLEHDGLARLAVFRAGKVLETEEKPLDAWRFSLTGLNLDRAWENIIVQIGGITIAEGNTLDEQIAVNEERAKIQRRIARLEKQARAEKQPRRKWELAEEVKKLKGKKGKN